MPKGKKSPVEPTKLQVRAAEHFITIFTEDMIDEATSSIKTAREQFEKIAKSIKPFTKDSRKNELAELAVSMKEAEEIVADLYFAETMLDTSRKDLARFKETKVPSVKVTIDEDIHQRMAQCFIKLLSISKKVDALMAPLTATALQKEISVSDKETLKSLSALVKDNPAKPTVSLFVKHFKFLKFSSDEAAEAFASSPASALATQRETMGMGNKATKASQQLAQKEQ